MKKHKLPGPDSPCPCGSGKSFSECCGPFILGEKLPGTATQLMRSRYSAYVIRDAAYLLDSWHPRTRPEKVEVGPDGPGWIGLKIVNQERGDLDDIEGTVEFIARYKVNGKAHRMHEISRFLKEGGRWFYLGGELDSSDA